VWVSPSSPQGAQPDKRLSQVRSDDRYAAHKPAESDEEIAKQDEEAVQFNTEPYERPAAENKSDSQGKGDRSCKLLFAGEEGESLLGSKDKW
ncbi:hypothetical protein McanCB49686_008104, partial [Microsporum canis]